MNWNSLAKFTVDLLVARWGATSERGLAFELPNGTVVDNAGFVDWLTAIGSPVRIRGQMRANVPTLSTSLLTGAEWDQLRLVSQPFKVGFETLLRPGEREGVRVLAEGGTTELGFDEFLLWLEVFDLGDQAWISANWREGIAGLGSRRQLVLETTALDP